MPEKPTKAKAISPVMIKVIPGPSNPFGIIALFNLCFIPAIATMARVHPMPEPTPRLGLKEGILADYHEKGNP